MITPQDLVIAISQSGETADTLAAVREAKHKGAVVGVNGTRSARNWCASCTPPPKSVNAGLARETT